MLIQTCASLWLNSLCCSGNAQHCDVALVHLVVSHNHLTSRYDTKFSRDLETISIVKVIRISLIICLFVISETTPNSNSSWNSWPLKMGQIGCSETSVNSYQYTHCNIPKERRHIFQFSLPIQSTCSNVYSVIHAQIYPSEFCHLVVLLNAFFRLNSYLTENAETV